MGSLLRSRKGEDTEFDTVRVQIGGLPAEEISELRDHDAVLDAPLRRLLRSSIVVPLIDASLLPPDPGGIDGRPIARYDRTLAGTLELLRKFLAAERGRRARRMFPLFVITKFDLLPPESFRALEGPAGPPAEWTAEGRQLFGRRLLRRYLPETARFVSQGRSGGVSILPAEWFFSGVRLEGDRNGARRIARRLRDPAGGWEPDYSFDEYRALLERLGVLARRVPADPDD